MHESKADVAGHVPTQLFLRSGVKSTFGVFIMIWRGIKMGMMAGALLALSGCAQIHTVRQWWRVWRNPSSTVPASSPVPQKVTLNLETIARQHPAWKLAQQLETSPPTAFSLKWIKPENQKTISFSSAKSTFMPDNNALENMSFAEAEQVLTASGMENFATEMTRQQQAAWDEWQKNISRNLQEDRRQIGQTMRVDLNDRIEQTQKNIPAIAAPYTPPAEIQSEMINLRLKLLSNINLPPADKAAAQDRLEQLEAQWNAQLRKQAQETAEKQQYWRETVPHQMRQAGESDIEQTLQMLEQKDQKAIDLTLGAQRQLLRQDDARDAVFALTLPLITDHAAAAKSTFRTPVLSAKSVTTSFSSLNIPTAANAAPLHTSRLEIRQLKQIALQAARRAVMQSATSHHWEWENVNPSQTSSLPDVTAIVLRETNFQRF